MLEHDAVPMNRSEIAGIEKTIRAQADELATLRARLAEVEAENERLREWLESIADAYDARSDLFASEDDCAASLAARARAALAQPKEPDQ